MYARKPKILCVDDEPVNLRLLEGILELRGYDIIKASNGKDALEKINEQDVDIVLLDVMMPGLSGFEVCKTIKDDEKYRNIPVILITALSSKNDRIKGIEVGAEDFITKPFDQGEVLARIKMLLKMRDLNNGLNQAYNKLTTITSLGRRLIKNFDPLNFNFESDIDNLIAGIIRPAYNKLGKPEMVVVHFPYEHDKQKWYLFESTIEGFNKKSIEFDFEFGGKTNQESSSTVFFYTQEDIANSNLYPLIRKIEQFRKPIINMVGFLSSSFCIATLNYGREVNEYDASVLDSLVMQTLFLSSLSTQIKETDDAFAYTVYALARAAEVNDEDTGNHILRVGEYCSLIAKQLNMPGLFCRLIKLQATLHDVGKIHIPSEILKKPSKLTPEEFNVMKKHTTFGAKIIGDHSRLTMAKEIAITHHEAWDGSGYPYGLKAEQIALSGRILNIADQYDALRNKRAYKPALDHKTTYAIITEGDGRTMPYHFDPKVFNAFKEIGSAFEEAYEKLKG